MVVELHVFGGSPNFSAKSSVGFVMHVVVELIRIGIGSTSGPISSRIIWLASAATPVPFRCYVTVSV